MSKVIDFIKGSVEEMTSKVTWPKYSELQSSTVLVIVASLIFAGLIGSIDLLFDNGMRSIYETLMGTGAAEPLNNVPTDPNQ